jgi:5-methyltetrahydrofolate--homocysteine methyltransferase
MEHLEQLKQAIIKGDLDQARPLTEAALSQGMDPERVLGEGLIAGMDVVGEEFKAGEVYIPEVLLAAKTMQDAMSVLKPLLVESGVKPRGTVVMGTVRGDLHDIGKNLVAMMLEGAGFEVVDLGNDVPPEKFVEVAEEKGAQVIGMSALLTTTMHAMKDTVDTLMEKGLHGKIKTIVGGAPLTAAFAEEIGATGYGNDAAAAVDLAKELVGE